MLDFLFNILLRAVSWRFFLVAVVFLSVAWLLSSLNLAGTAVFFYAFVATIAVGGGIEIWRMVKAARERRGASGDAGARMGVAPHQTEGNDDVRS